MSLDTFEQSLLTELRHHVVARTPVPVRTRRRRRAAGITGGLAVAGGAAAAFVLGSGIVGPSAAYAVESQPGGDVVVTVRDLSDAHGLEQALAAKGVAADITYARNFSQDQGRARTPSGLDGTACSIELAKVDGALRFRLGAAQVSSDAVLDIVTSGSSATDAGSPVAVTWSGGSC